MIASSVVPSRSSYMIYPIIYSTFPCCVTYDLQSDGKRRKRRMRSHAIASRRSGRIKKKTRKKVTMMADGQRQQ